MQENNFFYESFNYSSPLVRVHQVVLMRLLFYVTCTIWGFQISNGFVEVESFQDGKNQLYLKIFCQMMSLRTNFTTLEDDEPTEYSYR